MFRTSYTYLEFRHYIFFSCASEIHMIAIYTPEGFQQNSLPNVEVRTDYTTRMHSSRMRTARALTDRIRVGGHVGHACPLPCTPRCHACPPAHTCHPLPCTPTPCHTRPPTHANCHTCPLAMHAPPATHAPPAHMPPPSVNRMTDRCKTITLANFVCGR